jgi:hypothetical protein
MSYTMLLLLLLAGHALCDFPLQQEYLALGKDHTTSPPPFPGMHWAWFLTWHAFIHGAVVALITGSALLGVCETIAHWIIDYAKCEGVIDFNVDQILHIGCKLVWFIAYFTYLQA